MIKGGYTNVHLKSKKGNARVLASVETGLIWKPISMKNLPGIHKKVYINT